jgi:hypothetical protein
MMVITLRFTRFPILFIFKATFRKLGLFPSSGAGKKTSIMDPGKDQTSVTTMVLVRDLMQWGHLLSPGE